MCRCMQSNQTLLVLSVKPGPWHKLQLYYENTVVSLHIQSYYENTVVSMHILSK